ncbi:outer membrane protein assembly factor BamB family protein [Planctomicrobium piriforme]|uniref:PQQ-like domain-containing protein n=1 Tax=Planctomicrobium piriforme TaxID=1576369 RepID=A0A1I3EZ09_9PLAN|nr:PQQ-binding-like beta-propeller repeat protein [Planctomicrobium piriforme]SFI04192.1 PQQ-like domain-containing protein [Planctomicrobium piriforme]
MLFRRIVLAAVVCLVTQQVASAQFIKRPLPNENELNRLGLTMAWWGQATVNPALDQVEYFEADEQNVYVQSSTGMISTFHGETGRRMWSQLVGAPNQQGFPVTSSETEVLLGVGMKVFALDKTTGEMRWELILPSPPSAPPKGDDDFLYVATLNSKILAYDARKLRTLTVRGMMPQWANRSELWTFQMPLPSNSSPIPAGENVVFSSDKGMIYSLGATHKELRFQLEVGGKMSAPLAYSRDYVFACDTHSRLLCVNIKNGRVVWAFSSGAPIRRQPHVVGSQVFATVPREGLTSLSVTTGLQQWYQPRATDVIAVSDKRVYAGDPDENVLILDRETGQILAQMRLRDFPIRVHNDRTDRLYLASPGGTIVALRELGSDFPVYHLYPERRPILPLLAPDEPAESMEQ